MCLVAAAASWPRGKAAPVPVAGAAASGGGDKTAWAQLRQTDHARTAHLRHPHGADPADHRLYHLVIDTTAVPLEACADAIVAAASGAMAAERAVRAS